MPVLHLHRHDHREGVVDQEARTVVERLATQHGELFSFLHQEIAALREDMVRKQFAEEVVDWAGRVQGEVERQGRELTTLKNDLQKSSAALLAKVDRCKREMHTDLVGFRALILDTQKPLQEALHRFELTGDGHGCGLGKKHHPAHVLEPTDRKNNRHAYPQAYCAKRAQA